MQAARVNLQELLEHRIADSSIPEETRTSAIRQSYFFASGCRDAGNTVVSGLMLRYDRSMESASLWDGPAPGALGSDAKDIPMLDIYEPFGTLFRDCAILIFPGGGYGGLSAQEGEGYAGIFRLQGFCSYVLNYRLGSNGYRHPVMWKDATRAMRMVRSRAATDGFDPNKIVVIGSSAGGHLAATLMTRFDQGNLDDPDPVERMSSRPDLGILCYPVITMGKATHAGSRDNLLGPNASAELIHTLSVEEQVQSTTPPCFLWHTWEDGAVPIENTLLLAQALRRVGVPFECHIFQDGGHGLGMKDGHLWTGPCIQWLHKRLRD